MCSGSVVLHFELFNILLRSHAFYFFGILDVYTILCIIYILYIIFIICIFVQFLKDRN